MPAPTLRRGETIRIRDQRWTVSRQVDYIAASRLDVRGCEAGNRGVRASFLLPFEPFERLPRTDAFRAVGPTQWRHLARQALGSAVPAWDTLRTLAAARIDILPFQLEPALALVRGTAARLLIADEVGLGKTIQAGLAIAETLDREPQAHVLVLTPASLRDQWARELHDRFGLCASVLDAAAARVSSAAPGANPWGVQPLVVASIDYVKRAEVLRALEPLVWDLLVVDEAHGLAGRSDRHAAARALGERARALVLLTGTPHSGDDEAFARLCAVGELDASFPLLVFHRTRGDVDLPSQRRATWLRVAPTEAELAMHRALLEYARLVWRRRAAHTDPARLATSVLVKRACSSAASLARSIERRLSLLAGEDNDALQLALPLTAAAAADDEPDLALAAPGLDDPGEERQILSDLLAYARAAQRTESKIRAVRRLLRRCGEPAIVFTEYRDTLTTLADALLDFRTAELHGGQSAAERAEVVQRFTSGGADVLLATDAASEGLNLHHGCRLVINLEVPWTPIRLEQRVGRVDRIGQRRRVHQVQLVAARTSEETIVAALVRRRLARVREALGAMRRVGSERIAPLSEQDIAACVLAGAPEPHTASISSPALPAGLLTADLRHAAIEEGERAAAARALTPGAARAYGSMRPFVAALRQPASRACWAMRIEFGDRDDELIWETLVGIAYRMTPGRFSSTASVLHHVADARAAVRGFVGLDQQHLLAALRDRMRGPLALAISRERAIASAAKGRHGRLAAALVQPGLFDRRAERDADVHRRALHDMLRRCGDRVAQLERRAHPAIAALEPVFAALLR